jgi:adenylate cyclase
MIDMTNEVLELNPTPLAETVSSRGYILVVDDEEPNRTLLRDPLEANGYEVCEAENALQALEKIAQRCPDVILLDLMMPGMDGFQLCKKLKQNGRTASIPILMVTALTDRKERLMGIAAGANDFLSKPVDVQDLVLRVNNAAYTKALFKQLQAERENTDRLLRNFLPASIAERLKAGETHIADQFPNATVLVCDLVGFTALASHIDPEQLVFLLSEIFSAFDDLLEPRALEKIKTIGDAYMVVGGVPNSDPEPALAAAELALTMMQEIERFNTQYDTSIRIRVGISTGPVIAGVIGRKKFSYDLWGTTVNLAWRLESLAQPGSIQVDDATRELLKHKFRLESRTCPDLKNSTELTAWTLHGPL